MKLKVIYIILLNFSILVLNKLNLKNLSQTKKSTYKTNSYSIISIATNLSISTRSCDALIAEKVLIEFSEGVYNHIKRKVYLDGSYDNLFYPKSSSSDFKILETKLTKNCYGEQAKDYFCIENYFDDFVIYGKSKNITIDYEFISEDIIVKRKNGTTKDHFMELTMTNKKDKHDNYLNNFSLNLNFEDELPIENMIISPINYLINDLNNYDNNSEYIGSISWKFGNLTQDKPINFKVHNPYLGANCGKLVTKYL